ncbi:hypothetical protein [Thermomonas sp.]|nr:hypothetical protein [Thermomonas sp.]
MTRLRCAERKQGNGSDEQWRQPAHPALLDMTMPHSVGISPAPANQKFL